MIKKWQKLLIIHLIALLGLTACLGKKGEKNADCSVAEDFNSVTRRCENTARAPVGLLGDVIIYEDSGENEVILSYSDANNSDAVSCQINYNQINVKLRIKEWDESLSRALSAISSGNLAASSIDNVSFFSQSTNAFSEISLATVVSSEIASSRTNGQRSGLLRQVASHIRTAGQIAAGITSYSLPVQQGNIAISKASDLDDFANSIDNSCSCVGGVCKTIAIPDKNWFGEIGLSYTVNDGGSSSSSKEATIRVLSVNDAPIPVSQHFSFSESATAAPIPFSFTLALARDVEDDIFSSLFSYSIVLDDPVKGTLTDCMNKPGSLGLTDRTCTYTPSDGNAFGIGAKASLSNFNGIDWLANGAGVYGNDLKVTFVENPLPRSGGLNASDGKFSVEIDVLGNEIVITIETNIENVGADTYNAHTVQNVVDALGDDIYASALISVTLNTPGNVSTGSSNLAGGLDAYDTITYTVNDGSSDSLINGVISFDITSVNDPPIASSPPLTLLEDVVAMGVVLNYFDAEADAALTCTVSALSPNIQLRSACSCALAVCTVDVVGLIDYDIPLTPGSLQYSVNNGDVSNTAQFDFTITPADDPPLSVYQNLIDISTGVNPVESATAFPSSYAFNLEPVFDVDSMDIPIYEIMTSPTNGTISACLDLPGSLGNTDLECIYTPSDGNLNGIGTASSVLINDVTYTALFDGDLNGGAGKTISVETIETVGVTPTAPLIYFDQTGTTNLNIRILVAPLSAGVDTIANDVVSVLNLHPYISKIILASTVSGGTEQSTGAAQNLAGGTGGVDFFDYKVTVGSGVSEIGRVNINITPVDDTPVICHYSSFKEAPECGVLGCTKNVGPIGNIVPNKEGVYFYDSSSALCLVSKNLDSSGSLLNTDWEIVSSYVANQVVNEKDVIIIEGMKVDEGGGDAFEDVQLLRVSNVTSSNMSLIPVSKIKFFYDNAEVDLGDNFGAAANGSEDSQEFKIEIIPAGLVSGTSTITFELNDITGGTIANTDGVAGASPINVSFNVVVNPVSAIHNGWENIRAIGPKVSVFGPSASETKNVLDMTEVCSYGRSHCNGGKSCSGTSGPLSSVVPDKKFAVFYNTSSQNCFYADGTDSADWKPLKGLSLPDQVYCNITSTEFEPSCDQGSNLASCIGDGSPVAALLPTSENSFYWDRASNTCYRSRDLTLDGLDVSDWEDYKSTASSYLEWKPFTISGTGALSGYEVFRRLPNTTFDYKKPINKNPIGVSTYNYTDNAENSWLAPVPKTVYFYEVRPIIDNISTGTNEIFKEARVFIPPENMAFAHRWMINQSMCNTMNSTGIEPSSNFRCPYVGPGDSAGGYYDIGQDLIIERFEASCNFTRSPACDTASGDCVRNGDPNGIVNSTLISDIFYDRSSGSCYKSNGAGSTLWNLVIDADAGIFAHDAPESPPIVNVSQNMAFGFCSQASLIVSDFLGYNAGISRKLPTKKEQMAYSQWDMAVNTDGQVSTLETGLSINSSPKCNSSSASGLSSNYSDTDVPDTNTRYSLPGTASSNIRSVMTGSSQTALCKSRFDVQDVVGNVKEWVNAIIDCDDGTNGLSTCRSVTGADGTAGGHLIVNSASVTGYSNFALDGVFGPCRDTLSDGTCNSFLDKWLIDEERYSAGRWFVPLGLPAHTNYPIDNPFLSDISGDAISPYMFEIGPTSGITSQQLHNDAMTINSHYIFAEATGEGSMATGGSYLNGQEAGVYSFELLPKTDTSFGYLTIGDISFKAVGVLGAGGITVDIIQSVGSSDPPSCVYVAGTPGTIVITIGDDGVVDLPPVIINAINASCNLGVLARLSGNMTTSQSATLAPISMIDSSAEKSSRVDVGFRCVLPITNADYVE